MKTLEDAEALAHAMVRIGNNVGRNTMAIISDMGQPLGNAIGNALEVKEAIETLQGNGPEDLTELVMTLGSQMVVVGGKAQNLDEARKMLEQAIQDGSALESFRTFLENQDGDGSVVDDVSKLPQAKYQIELPAQSEGIVTEIIANEVGVASMMLGAGRQTKEDEIDLSVGLVLHKKVGDSVNKGEALLTIHSNQEQIDNVKDKLLQSITISDTGNEPTLIHKIITE
ncbi:thymidine phosphorylase [Mycobacteroides abscessus]|nr:thymidine phosphorylase [Mycobacteroides abscessus]